MAHLPTCHSLMDCKCPEYIKPAVMFSGDFDTYCKYIKKKVCQREDIYEIHKQQICIMSNYRHILNFLNENDIPFTCAPPAPKTEISGGFSW